MYKRLLFVATLLITLCPVWTWAEYRIPIYFPRERPRIVFVRVTYGPGGPAVEGVQVKLEPNNCSTPYRRVDMKGQTWMVVHCPEPEQLFLIATLNEYEVCNSPRVNPVANPYRTGAHCALVDLYMCPQGQCDSLRKEWQKIEAILDSAVNKIDSCISEEYDDYISENGPKYQQREQVVTSEKRKEVDRELKREEKKLKDSLEPLFERRNMIWEKGEALYHLISDLKIRDAATARVVRLILEGNLQRSGGLIQEMMDRGYYRNSSRSEKEELLNMSYLLAGASENEVLDSRVEKFARDHKMKPSLSRIHEEEGALEAGGTSIKPPSIIHNRKSAYIGFNFYPLGLNPAANSFPALSLGPVTYLDLNNRTVVSQNRTSFELCAGYWLNNGISVDLKLRSSGIRLTDDPMHRDAIMKQTGFRLGLNLSSNLFIPKEASVFRGLNFVTRFFGGIHSNTPNLAATSILTVNGTNRIRSSFDAGLGFGLEGFIDDFSISLDFQATYSDFLGQGVRPIVKYSGQSERFFLDHIISEIGLGFKWYFLRP